MESVLDNALLNKVYYDPAHPSSYGGVDKLHSGVKHGGLSRKDVSKFLSAQDTYTLHRPKRVRYKSAKCTAHSVDHIWHVDLCSMVFLAPHNNNMKYLLVCIDTFSRFLWVRPLLNKSSGITRDGFKSIFEEGRVPALIAVDGGTEFKGEVRNIMKILNIGMFTLHGASKASIAERVQRTIKEKIFKHLTRKNTKRYIDELQQLVKSYNNATHRELGTTPSIKSADCTFTPDLKPLGEVHHTIKLGTYVRVSRVRVELGKSYEGNYNIEIFTVSKLMSRNGVAVYELSDLNGEKIEGIFYKEEIQPVYYDKNKAYKIEKILHTKKQKGKTMYYVRWLGFPRQFDSYVTQDQLSTV